MRNLHGDFVHPLLPEIPVGLVDDTDVSTVRSTLVGNLSGREGDVVLGGQATRESAVGSV